MRKEHNGWGNYPTWEVALWLLNDERACQCWGRSAKEILLSVSGNAVEAKKLLAREIADDFEGNMPKIIGIYADMLGWALSLVDWGKIASAILQQEQEKEATSIETL